MKKILRRRYFLAAFALVVVVLAILRHIHPEWVQHRQVAEEVVKEASSYTVPDSVQLHSLAVDSLFLRKRPPLTLLGRDGKPVKNRVTGVVRFETAFPDANDVQLATAERLGIAQIANRDEAHNRITELVYIGDNPFYSVQRLNQSIPYLVPRAATLLDRIGRAFNDSLVTKGYPPHKLLVTSVLRTKEDVSRLRRHNGNAAENSCHQYATTFDIAYNRFLEIRPDGTDRIQYLTPHKSILSEVLNDLREAGACYVKYERKQSCFHITCR